MSGRILPFAFLLHLIFSCKPTPPVPEANDLTIANLQDTVVYKYLQKPDSLFDEKKFDSALFYYKKSAEKYLVENNGGGFLRAITRTGRINVILGKYEEAIESLQPFDSLALLENFPPGVVSEFYYALGQAYFYRGDPEDAANYYKSSLDLSEKIYPEPSLSKANSYLGLGNVYCFSLHDYNNGQRYFEKALEEVVGLNDTSNTEILFRCYYNLAANNRFRKNFDKAEYYGKGALEASMRLGNRFFREYTLTLLASIYEEKKNYDLSLYHLEQGRELIESENPINYDRLANNSIGIALIYKLKKDYDRSISYYLEALQLIKNHNLDIPEREAHSLADLGSVYHEKGDDKNAYFYLNKSITLSKQKNLSSLKLAYEMLGKYYHDNSEYSQAIDCFQKALAFLDFKKENATNALEGSYFIDIYYLLNSLANSKKSKALAGGTIHYDDLESALSDFVLADSLIQIFRKNNLLASDELWLSSEIQQYYESALECVHFLYLSRPDKNLTFTALRLMEQNKARILSKSLEKSEQLKSVGVPDSLIQYWRDLNLQISHWQNQHEINVEDERHRKIAENQLLKLTQKSELLNKFFEENYDSYLSFRTGQSTPNPDSLQDFAKKNQTVILSFYQGDSTITALAIGPNNSFLYFIPIHSIIVDINIYQHIITNGNPVSGEEYKAFTEAAHNLYVALVEPGLKETNPENTSKNLVIIADRALATIPFEALTEENAKSSEIDYKNLKYLIRRFEISYLPAVSFLEVKSENKEANKHLNFAGWGYTSLVNNTDFSDLNFGNEELLSVSSSYASDLFLNERATEKSFKREAENYDILHLSVHGSSTSETNQPCLYFNPDSENDGILYPFELYNLKLKSRMAVLSACETGKGKYYSGEGVFSIARGFFYAGCPSLVVNLWKVRDESSLRVQTDFYKNLNKGLAKSTALKEAKLSRIASADKITSHPTFWAATILIGESAPVYSKQNSVGKMAIFIAAIFLFTVVSLKIYRKFFPLKNKNKRKSDR